MLIQQIINYTWSHPSNRGRRLRALGSLFGWQLWKRIVGTPREISAFGDMKLRCHASSKVAGTMIYSSGWPDYDEMHFVRRFLRPGDHFIDVGANIGTYTLLAARCTGPDGQVLAIEGGRTAHARCRENIELNGLGARVTLRLAAVSSEPGKVRFIQKYDQANRIFVEYDDALSDQDYDEVDAVTLDELLDGRSFAMGKIDIEGAEPLAFQGGPESLKTGNPPVWLMELKGRLLKNYDTTPEQLADNLDEYGFRLGVYDADHNELTFPQAPWEDHGNVFAVRHDAVDAVRARLADSDALPQAADEARPSVVGAES